MKTEPYLDQLPIWPVQGRHILAGFDEHHIVIYQAYNSEIAAYAVGLMFISRSVS
jgi:hypothetical protein